jgi:hypothetical protein
MRRASLVGGLLLACNTGTPEPRPQSQSAKTVEAPAPVAAPEASPATPGPGDSSAAAVPPTADATGQARYRALTPAVLETMNNPLEGDRGLAYPPQLGPFGPAPDGVLVLRTRDPGTLDGFVETRRDGAATRLPLPALDWAMNTVHDVLFEDVDGDGRDEALILVSAMTGVGPTAAEEFFATHVIRWDGAAFVHLPEVEQRIGKAQDAAAIRRALKQPAPAAPR